MDLYELGIRDGMEKSASLKEAGAIGQFVRSVGTKAKSLLTRGTGVPGSAGAGAASGKALVQAPASTAGQAGMRAGLTSSGAIPANNLMAHGFADVEKALGVNKGSIGAQMGKMGPDNYKAIAEAQRQGIISNEQARHVVLANRQAAQQQAAAQMKKNLGEQITGATQPGAFRQAMSRVGTGIAIGAPAMMIAQGAGQGVEQGTMPQGNYYGGM